MYYDKDFNFLKDRSFWLCTLLLIFGANYFQGRFNIDSNRWRRWNREHNLEEQPGHHYSNRGGVLFMKQFVGFEKYHRNNDETIAWYYKAYPGLKKPEKKTEE